MKINTTRHTGFTLVEIMIVVAIIGMLATIAIPNYAKARGEAQRTTCISNLQQLEGAVQQWAMEQKKADGEAVTYSDISPYLRYPAICPAGGKTFQDSYTLTTVESRPTCQRKPDIHKLPQQQASHG
jgi:prepilin-type N-terminal cleavage/methylation domain-containing protein